jgi:hypothetical protein
MKWYYLLLLPIFAFGGLNEDGDFQIWNKDTLNIRAGKKTLLKGDTEFRYGRNRNKLYYKHYEGTVVFIRSPFTLIETGYRQIFFKVDGKWQKIYSPLFDLTLQTQTKARWVFKNRNRFQYLISKRVFNGKNRWLYSNKLEVISSMRLTHRKVAPFISNEFFWQETKGISENRFEVGFLIPYHQKTQLNLSYLSRNLKDQSKKWIHHNIIKVHFSLHF